MEDQTRFEKAMQALFFFIITPAELWIKLWCWIFGIRSESSVVTESEFDDKFGPDK